MSAIGLQRDKGVWLSAVLMVGAVALATLSGCDDGYPEDQKYPGRTDPLVLTKAEADPLGLDAPGPEGWRALDTEYTNPETCKGKLLNPSDVPAEIRGDLDKLLEKHFGTPANPSVEKPKDEFLEASLADEFKNLELDDKTLQAGSRLYRQQCLHCHGLTGNGRGPTGYWVNPHPRDYRQGEFKFISSVKEAGSTRKAARADLVRVLQQGIDGSSMPSFGLLPHKELENLASYVIHLSIRGEVEFKMLKAASAQKAKSTKDFKVATEDGDAEGFDRYFERQAGEIIQSWIVSQRSIQPELSFEKYLKARTFEPPAAANASQPKADPEEMKRDEAIRRGYTLFQTQAGCAACHLDYGRKRNYKWDVWGTVTRPANLTSGVYRGGRRPIDFFYRIRAGIGPSGMPAQDLVKERKGHLSAAGLTDDEIWDLVEFVRALPYPGMLPLEIRDKIYLSAP